MEKFVITRGVKVIVDASHPYAQNVSKNAMDVITSYSIHYTKLYEITAGVQNLQKR